MKKHVNLTPSREVALTHISITAFLQATAVSLVLFAIPMFFAFKSKNIWNMLGAMFCYFLTKFLLAKFIIRKKKKDGEHKAFIAKEMEARRTENEASREATDRYLEKVRSKYRIESIGSVGDVAGVFMISFATEIFTDVVPMILVNGVHVKTVVDSKFHAVCYALPAIKSDAAILRFQNNEDDFHTMQNPYFYSGPEELPVVWQCEGTKHEKKIIIPMTCFPYGDPGDVYPIALLINNKLRGSYLGKIHEATNELIIRIPDVEKHECVGRDCVLRFDFDKRRVFTLPKPTKMTFNGKPVKEEKTATV